ARQLAATCHFLAAAAGPGQAVSMTNATSTSQPAAASGTIAIGGDLPVARLGFGTMRLPTGTFAGPVRDPQDGIAVLRRAVEPDAERFAALAKLRSDGLIRHLGVSNVDAAQLAEARAIAPVAAVQNAYHVHATADAALLAECGRTGTAFVPFFPLGGGLDPIDTTQLEKTAARHGATVQQVALAALLAASPVMLPIPG